MQAGSDSRPIRRCDKFRSDDNRLSEPKTFLGSCLAAPSGASACRTNDRCRRKRSFDAARLYREDAFAVGTSVAGRPPHRSGRADFPHPAPTSGV